MITKAELKYVPGLDALRGLACLSVCIFHSNIVTKVTSPGIPFKGGSLGVDLFFVLSGFLITTILLNEYERYSTISFKNFYIKRILRLYPPILISVIVFIVPILFTDKLYAIANIVSLLTYTGNCFMLVQHFTDLPYPLLSGHSWSLAVEEQFYLTFPFLLFLALRFYRRNRSGNLISLFPVFWLLYFLVVIASTILLGKWFYKFFFWRFFEIYLGAFIAIIYSDAYQRISKKSALSGKIKNIVHRVYSNKVVLIISIILAAGLIIYPFKVPFYNYLAAYNLQYILYTFFCSVLIINVVYPRHSFYAGFLSKKVLVSLGKVSYGFYLYTPFISHYTGLLVFNGDPFRNTTTMVTCDLISISVSLLFSYLSFTFIERNILKLKSRFTGEKAQKTVKDLEAGMPKAV